jgi:8-oxo-dGTP diphosphatase
MPFPKGLFPLVREIGRHVLRRPVPGIAAFAETEAGVVLIRRSDTGEWALPGGTLEWGESLSTCIGRELQEEAGVTMVGEPELVGVFSKPGRDPRFHAVTTLVRCRVSMPRSAPHNPMEILEVKVFPRDALPKVLSHGMNDMLDAAIGGLHVIE